MLHALFDTETLVPNSLWHFPTQKLREQFRRLAIPISPKLALSLAALGAETSLRTPSWTCFMETPTVPATLDTASVAPARSTA
jgi:hypothetical protein